MRTRADGSVTRPEPTSCWAFAPGWRFHYPVAFGTLVALYLTSVPGRDLFPLFPVVGAGFVLVVIWLVRLIGWLNQPAGLRRGHWQWLIGPACGVILLALVYADAPLRVRFELAKSSFNSQVENLEPRGSYDEWADLEVPDRIGGYGIISAYQVGDAVIFYEENGNFIDDAGFAYFPSGPTDKFGDATFENPQFRHLSGDWYAWTASW